MTDFENQYRYTWPQTDLAASDRWQLLEGSEAYARQMPEDRDELANDSRWPAFFPSPMCIVTTHDDNGVALEKVVGASIVNRFPYVIALSFCIEELSTRHHIRRNFATMLESSGSAAIQFLPPGQPTDSVMNAIAATSDDLSRERIQRTRMPTRSALTNGSPVFDDAYMVYEASLVQPSKDFEGHPIYETPWTDVGSHRVYFLEINAIQLDQEIAEGRRQIHWRSLPVWEPKLNLQDHAPADWSVAPEDHYQKGYTPHYSFPSPGTIAFEADGIEQGRAVKYLAPLPEDQVEVDNDRARWPCFFPSPVGMITTWSDDGIPNLMPCGSTTVVSRHPMVITPCVSYAAINERYAPRSSLDIIRKSGRFGCGVPFINPTILEAIRYAGNISLADDPSKIAHAGLEVESAEWAPILRALPVHFDCEVVGEVRLGTHIMFLGEVKRIQIRADVTADNPLEWLAWANVDPLAE